MGFSMHRLSTVLSTFTRALFSAELRYGSCSVQASTLLLSLVRGRFVGHCYHAYMVV